MGKNIRIEYIILIFITIFFIFWGCFQLVVSTFYFVNSEKIEVKIGVWASNIGLPEEVDRYLWLDKVEIKGNDIVYKLSFDSNCTDDLMQLVLDSRREFYANGQLPDIIVDFMRKGYTVSFLYYTYDGELVDEMVIPLLSSTQNKCPS